ncbi:MAG: hypothetical protein EXR62_08865 [Chloroflexi bacterium]|nr:hypothetical protein [Chloroflexota bacterium]
MPTLNFKPRVTVYDANMYVGHRHDGPSAAGTPAEALAEMDFHGIERAVIYHAQAEAVSPLDGNKRLMEWLDAVPPDFRQRFIPQWGVLPVQDSFDQVKTLEMEGQVSSVRLINARAGILPFRPWGYDALLSWLSKARIPLWISLPDTDLDQLVPTLQAYPELVTVLVGAHYTHALLVRPLLDNVPNAYLELSRYEPIGEFEALFGEYGVERFVYGSWFPRYAMGPILFYLHQTTATDEDLAKICSDNLKLILKREGRRD